MKVAVLGATGFIGSWAVRALVARGATVTALARPTSDTWRIDSLPGVAITRSDDWTRTLRELAPEALLCLDWSGVSAAERDDDAVQSANVTRQARIVDAALAAGVRGIVGVGSQAEYGPVDGPIAEDRRPSPTTAYGRAKIAARESLAAASEAAGVRWAWARVFSVFGPLETGTWLLPSIARAAAARTPMRVSNGTHAWSYLYAADAGLALADLVLDPRASGTFNLGHPVAPPLRESILTFAAALGDAAIVEFGEQAGMRLEPQVDRLQALGWNPITAHDAALATTARWLQGEAIPDPLVPGVDLPAVP